MQRKLSKIKTVSKPWVMTAARLDAMKTNWGIYLLKGASENITKLPLSPHTYRDLKLAIYSGIDELRRRNDDRAAAGKKRPARKG